MNSLGPRRRYVRGMILGMGVELGVACTGLPFPDRGDTQESGRGPRTTMGLTFQSLSHLLFYTKG